MDWNSCFWTQESLSLALRKKPIDCGELGLILKIRDQACLGNGHPVAAIICLDGALCMQEKELKSWKDNNNSEKEKIKINQ